MIVLVT